MTITRNLIPEMSIKEVRDLMRTKSLQIEINQYMEILNDKIIKQLNVKDLITRRNPTSTGKSAAATLNLNLVETLISDLSEKTLPNKVKDILKGKIIAIIDHMLKLKVDQSAFYAALYFAAKSGDIEIATKLIDDANCNVNSAVKEFLASFPLFIAVMNQDENMCKFLLEKNAQTNQQIEFGTTALIHAAGFGQTNIVKLILNHMAEEYKNNNSEETANIDLLDNTGESAIFKSVRAGNADITRLLIDAGAAVNLTNNKNQSLLIVAAEATNNVKVVELLIDAKVDINYEAAPISKVKESGDNALVYACIKGHKDVAYYLLECGINVENDNGYKALYSACANGLLRVVQFIGEKIESSQLPIDEQVKVFQDAFQFAIEYGELEIVNYLLSVNERFKKLAKKILTISLLQFAMKPIKKSVSNFEKNNTIDNKKILFGKLLDACEAEIEQKIPEHGCNLLQFAIRIDQLPDEATVFAYCFEIMKRISNKHQRQIESMARTSNNNNFQTVNNKFYNDVDPEGNSLLQIIAYYGVNSLIKPVIERGADIQYARKDGVTALTIAVAQQHLDCVKTLLSYQAIDINKVVDNSSPLLLIACDEQIKYESDQYQAKDKKNKIARAKQIVKLLIKNNAKILSVITAVFRYQPPDLKIIKILLDYKSKWSDDELTCALDYLLPCKSTLSLPLIHTILADIDYQNVGRELLMSAIESNLKICAVLDERKQQANLNSSSKRKSIREVYNPIREGLNKKIKILAEFYNDKTLVKFLSDRKEESNVFNDTTPVSVSGYSFLKEKGFSSDEIQELKKTNTDKNQFPDEKKEVGILTKAQTWGNGVLTSDHKEVIPVISKNNNKNNVWFYCPDKLKQEFDLIIDKDTLVKLARDKGDQGIKHIGSHGAVGIKLGKKIYYGCIIKYEFKLLSTSERLFVVKLPADDKSGALYVAFKTGALHENSESKALSESVRHNSFFTVELPKDILIEDDDKNNNNNNNNNSLQRKFS